MCAATAPAPSSLRRPGTVCIPHRRPAPTAGCRELLAVEVPALPARTVQLLLMALGPLAPGAASGPLRPRDGRGRAGVQEAAGLEPNGVPGRATADALLTHAGVAATRIRSLVLTRAVRRASNMAGRRRAAPELGRTPRRAPGVWSNRTTCGRLPLAGLGGGRDGPAGLFGATSHVPEEKAGGGPHAARAPAPSVGMPAPPRARRTSAGRAARPARGAGRGGRIRGEHAPRPDPRRGVEDHSAYWELAAQSQLADLAADLVGPDVTFHHSSSTSSGPPAARR